MDNCTSILGHLWKKAIWVAALGLACTGTLSASEASVPPNVNYCCDLAPTAEELYLEGYLQALIDAEFCEERVNVKYRRGTAYLWGMPNSCHIADLIIDRIADVHGVCDVKVVCHPLPESYGIHCLKERIRKDADCYGTWLPSGPLLFGPLIADPRQVQLSGAYRVGDETIGPHLGAVAFGDDFPFYRWYDVGRKHAEMQIGLESGIFAVFNLDKPSMDLINADYYVAFPLTYAFDCWSFRLRIYHISSHLGDEFLLSLAQPNLVRTNPSFEALDFFSSYQLTKSIRLFGGVGYYLKSDRSCPFKHLYIAYGFEVKMFCIKSCFYKLFWQPYLATYFQNREYHGWKPDSSYSFGVELGRMDNCGNRVRLSLEYHNGFSFEGQLCLGRTTYTALKLLYAY